MKTYYLIIGIFFVGIISSCSHKRAIVEVKDAEILNSLDFTEEIDTISGEQIADIHYLPLEGSEEHFLGDVTKLCVQDSLFVIANKGQDKIVCYNDKGEFLYEIDSKGAGPEEYLELASFTVTSTSIYTIDNYQHKICKYSITDGKFITKYDVDFIAWDMEAFDDDSFLFTCLPIAPGRDIYEKDGEGYAVWKTNGKWETQDSYIPYSKDYIEPLAKRRWFTRNGDEIQFDFINNDGFYSISKSGNVCYTPVLFAHPWPRENDMVTIDMRDEKAEFISETPLITSNYGAVEICEGLGGNLYIFDIKNGKFFRNSNTSAEYYLNEVKGVKGDTFVGILNDDYEKYLTMVEYGFPIADKETETLLEKGGMCLIMYEMK
jgi:hypothetical protein